MAYTYSKTDWQATDYFNYTDWERIRVNVAQLVEECKTLGLLPSTFTYTIATMPSGTSIPYISNVNTFENSRQSIYEALPYTLPDYRVKVTWYARLSELYTRNPTYDDWNRWEETFATLRQNINNLLLSYMYCGEALCGGY